MKTPIAAFIADIHYNLVNFHLADSATRQAIDYCAKNKIPLVIAGDLHDTKAAWRGECIHGLLDTFKYAMELKVKIYLIPGNHCLITEKSQMHSLHFLEPYCELIDNVTYVPELSMWLVPYLTTKECVEKTLARIPTGSKIIMHQGLRGAFMGEYLVDKTSVIPEMFDGYRVISGHYHRAQDIKCGKTGLWSYIGSPYTITFAEANDGVKGFRILMSNGDLDMIATGLRSHVIIERHFSDLSQGIYGGHKLNKDDLLWLKVKGPASELAKLNKKALGEIYIGHSNYRLDLIPDESAINKSSVQNKTGDEILDDIISRSEETKEQKEYLCKLWREIL